MAYQQFMYDEAFDFKNNQDVHQLKQQHHNDNYHLEEHENEADCSQQRLPPLGACSNEPTTEIAPSAASLTET